MTKIKTKLASNQKLYEDLVITRKRYIGQKTGEQYFAYKIDTKINKRDFTVNMICKKKDVVGYELLDAVFEYAKTPVVLMTEETVGYNGSKTVSYYAFSLDEDGFSTKAILFPRDVSDRNVLENVTARLDEIIRRKNAEDSAALDKEDADNALIDDEDLIEEGIDDVDDDIEG